MDLKNNLPEDTQWITTLGNLRAGSDLIECAAEVVELYPEASDDTLVWMKRDDADVLVIEGKIVEVGGLMDKVMERVVRELVGKKYVAMTKLMEDYNKQKMIEQASRSGVIEEEVF
jgi:hypothetical protein